MKTINLAKPPRSNSTQQRVKRSKAYSTISHDQNSRKHSSKNNQVFALSPKVSTTNQFTNDISQISTVQSPQNAVVNQGPNDPSLGTDRISKQATQVSVRIRSKQSRKMKKVKETLKEKEQEQREKELEEKKKFNEKLQMLLDKATQKQEELERQIEEQKQNSSGSFIPMFSNNHIQNLTINAQPNFSLNELAQMGSPQPIQYQIGQPAAALVPDQQPIDEKEDQKSNRSDEVKRELPRTKIKKDHIRKSVSKQEKVSKSSIDIEKTVSYK